MHVMADAGRSCAGVSGFVVILPYFAPPPALLALGTASFVTEVATATPFDLPTQTMMGDSITGSTRQLSYGSARAAAEWVRETTPSMILLTAVDGALLAGMRQCPSSDDIGAVAAEPVGHG